MATCPECDAEITVDDADLEEMELGDPWDCEACGSRLRVSGVTPLEFEGDDEDEDEEDEDDEDAEKKEGEETDEDDVDELDEEEDGEKEDWDE